MRQKKTVLMAMVLFLSAVLCMAAGKSVRVHAETAPGVLVTEINYEDSTITIQLNSKDTELYVSDAKGKVWESVFEKPDVNHKITMDISWIPANTKYVLKLKGDYSTTVTSVALPKQFTNFKAVYNKVKHSVLFTNRGTRTVEWRKKDSYIWNTYDSVTFPTDLENMCTQGASLCFRLAPVNGVIKDGVFSCGERASKEITLTIPKKASAPSISINGSTFLIPTSKNMSYRIMYSNGTVSPWTSLTSARNLLLADIAPGTLYVDNKTAQHEVTLEFIKNATSSSQVSRIATVTVPVQEAPPSEEANGINLNYTSSTTLELIVKAASTTKPFEYTIVKPGSTLEIQKATWSTITKQDPIQITKTTAPNGSHIYIRKKTIPASATVKFALASKELDISTDSGVKYPDTAEIEELKTLVTTAGVCNTDNTSGNLSFSLYSPTKTTVSSLSFRDQYGNTKGSVSIKSSVALNRSSRSTEDKYIITTKITSTDKIDTVTDTLLYADITMENKDKVASTTTKGIVLYLYPASKVNNSADKTYQSAFERIIYSTESADKKSFTFQLDLGNAKVPDFTKAGVLSSTDTAVTSLSFDGYTLKPNTDYSVAYGSYTNEELKTIRTATITVNVAEFEKASKITTFNKEVPLKITLNDGEKLNNAVTIKLTETAVLLDSPIAWSIMERSLKETQKENVTNEDKSTSVVETEVITFELDLEIFSKTYDVGVSDVTWGGTSILKASTLSAGKAVIYLSNPKINKLTTSSTTTNNIVITLSNGFVIKNGCKLTIINAD